MNRGRVLVVDDSVVVRRVLANLVTSDPWLELAGTAATASIALQRISQVSPDVVLLDVEMPDVDGFEAARRIRAGWPKLPIVMCSAGSDAGSEMTSRALAAGASDLVVMPANLKSTADAPAFRDALLAKLRLLARKRNETRTLSPPSGPPLARTRQPARVELIAIGSSTGGPNALAEVLRDVPHDVGVPILIVQHMPPLFTKILAERLTATTSIRVVEAEHGLHLQPGWGYVAPGDHHMELVRDRKGVRIALHQGPQENSCRPAVDVTFRSAAAVYGAGVLGVVLTGMGHDGTIGARAIVEAGGRILVQDSASCVVPSMPASVAAAGLADAVIPIAKLGAELGLRVRQSIVPTAFGRGSVGT